MKKILITLLLVLICNVSFAQNSNVTQFMGIDVDGTKTEMIQKLKQKGFVYDAQGGYFTGDFNGYSGALIAIHTNKNKVDRIFVTNLYTTTNEATIIRSFNNLLEQFKSSSKYTLNYGEKIDDSERIGIQMSLYNKVYECVFYQDDNKMKSVWFRLFRNYNDYCIGIFYDNEYNKSHGEDL